MNEKYEITRDPLIEELEHLRNGRLSPEAKGRIWKEALRRSSPDVNSVSADQKSGFFTSLRLPALRFPMWRLAGTVAVVLLLLLGIPGIIRAANQSIPGDFLYPLKRNAEVAWLELVPEHRRINVKARLLERRVEEIRRLADAQRPIPPRSLKRRRSSSLRSLRTPKGGKPQRHAPMSNATSKP